MTVDPDSVPDSDLDDELDLGIDFGLDDEDDEYADEFAEFIQSLGLPDRLPPVWLPSLADLAAAARESVLLRRVGELAAWVGERRELTDECDLTEVDAAEAADRLGITPNELVLCWETAIVTDLVVVSDDGTADANPDLWPTGDDEEDIGTWAAGFTQVLQSLSLDAELAGVDELAFDGAAALMLPMFLAREHGEQIAALQEIARGMETEHLEDDAVWDAWVTEHGDPVTTLLARLAEHGAVEVDEETARLTPLTMLIMREELVEGGVDIPLLPPPTEMTASDLLTVVGGRDDTELTELADTWLATRDPETAATELLAAAAEATPAGRFYATTVLAKLPVVPWTNVLDDPRLRPYARDALGEPRDPADAMWLLMDGISASADGFGELSPQAVEKVTAATLPAGHEQETLADAWRLRHPLAHEVLTLIGTHHPDKKIAKAARTAAHKAQSLSD